MAKKNGYHHMTRDQRCQLQSQLSMGKTQGQIARQLGVSKSTICREIARNSTTLICDSTRLIYDSRVSGYNFMTADEMGKRRRSAASSTAKKMKGQLKDLVIKGLTQDWSPEQLAGRLKLQGISISFVTIYRYVRRDQIAGGPLYEHLRHGGKKYRSKKSRQAGVHCIPNRVDISERPATVDEKSSLGDWEGDTVISHGSRCAIITLVDRASKLTKMKKIGRKTMKNTNAAANNLLKNLTKSSIAFDNGKEFACHEKLSQKLGVKIYFARPYKSCDRGLNEHTNGLIRQYLPKNFDFKDVSHHFIRKIENKLNNRPRKVLNFKTPFEVFFGTFSTEACASVALHN